MAVTVRVVGWWYVLVIRDSEIMALIVFLQHHGYHRYSRCGSSMTNKGV